MIEIFTGKGFELLITWGPGLFIAALMLYGLYKLVYKIWMNIGLKIVEALEKPAAALSQQAQSMDRLTRSLEAYILRDQSEHREIIILLKINAERLDHLSNGLDRVSEQVEAINDRDKKRTIP
jgi:hypothetical protein